MKTIVKYARNMIPQEYRQCYSMSYLSEGDLIWWLKDARKYKNDTRAFMVKDEDKILGWGLLTEDGDIGVWTRKTERRRGIGTKIIKTMKRRRSILHCFPHDKASTALFARTGLIDEK